jgi:hypothetical protein
MSESGTFETSGDVRYLVTIWSLSGGKRTSRWQSISVAIDPERKFDLAMV